MTRVDKLVKSRQRSNFKAIECELRYYHQVKQQYLDARDDIINATAMSDVSSDGNSKGLTGDVVLSRVIELNSSAAILETERRIKAIEYALEQVAKIGDPARVKMIELKYFNETLTDQGIMQKLTIPNSTFYRWRRQFVELIANKLGWDVGQKDYKHVGDGKKKKANS